MPDYPEPNLDARGRRKTSPAADEFYSRKIHTVDDPDGSREAEINRLAKRLSRAKASGAVSQYLALKGRLVEKCLRFYYVTGANAVIRDDGVMHEGDFSNVDEIFIDALLYCVERYSARAPFTHMLANQFSNLRVGAAYAAAREDTILGGSNTSAPILLDAPVRRNDDGTTTVGDSVGTYDDADEEAGDGAETDGDDAVTKGEAEQDNRAVADAAEVLEEEGSLSGDTPDWPTDRMRDDAVDEALLLKTLSLVTSFLGKSGRAANDTRKLYTRMFFSETLTRVTKLRTEGELMPLQRQEKGLFGAVELPFQDTYTAERCRTIAQLWSVAFVDGVPLVRKPLAGGCDRVENAFDYGWSLPGAVYVKYLKSLDKAASDVLVSQQRSHYEELLGALRAKS